MPTRSFLFNHSPRWTLNRSGIHQHLPQNLQSWIYETGSLTQRLRNFYGDAVSVKILFQQWQKPFLSESQRLYLPDYRYSLVREVLLHVDNTPLILARTILPAATIRVAQRKLSNLGTRPLGEVIFSYPNLLRLETDICCIPPQVWSPALRQTIEIENLVCGRRTVYQIAHQPLLVSEFFMPAALDLSER